jgi:hypothetical protein
MPSLHSIGKIKHRGQSTPSRNLNPTKGLRRVVLLHIKVTAKHRSRRLFYTLGRASGAVQFKMPTPHANALTSIESSQCSDRPSKDAPRVDGCERSLTSGKTVESPFELFEPLSLRAFDHGRPRPKGSRVSAGQSRTQPQAFYTSILGAGVDFSVKVRSPFRRVALWKSLRL